MNLDVVLREDLAVLVDDDGRADHALDEACRKLLLAERAVLPASPVRSGSESSVIVVVVALAERELRRLVGEIPTHLVALGAQRVEESVKSHACRVQPGVIAAG